jgi:signal transduction histidine kinase
LTHLTCSLIPPKGTIIPCMLVLLTVCISDAVAKEKSVQRLTYFDVIRSATEYFDPNLIAKPVKLPDSWHQYQGSKFQNSWYSTRISLDKSDASFAVYIPRVSMNASVSVNGKEIGNGGRFTEPISRNHGRPLLFIAPDWVTEGRNRVELTIRVADNNWAFGYLGPVYVGDTSTLTSMYRTREFWQVHLTMALALLMLIFSIASVALYVRRRKDKYYFWFGSAMLLFAVDTFNVFIIDIPTSRHLWEIYIQMVVYAFAVATIIFIHRFTRIGWFGIERMLAAVFFIKLIVLLVIDKEHFFIAASIFNLVVMSYGLLLAFFVIRDYLKTSSFESGVTALSGLILLAVAFHTWLIHVGLVDPENLHIIQYGAPCFFLLISLSLARNFLSSLENTEALARDLDRKVRNKEKELAATYEELNILNQKKLLSEERGRIMREVHDGFGAHLIGALTMLETNKVDQKELSEYLKNSLLDLRIMIDSLDPNVDEISMAFGMLRMRVEPILKSRNISLHWDLYKLPDDLRLNSNKTLSLLRILQELFTNTIKHSVANQIKIDTIVSIGKTQRILSIEFWENGNGFNPDLNVGKGMRNMRNRIQELGGEIHFHNEPIGFKTSLTVPTLAPTS